MKDKIKQFLSYKGRISRKEYICRFLKIDILIIIFIGILYLTHIITNGNLLIMSLLAVILGTVIVILFATAKIERLHDLNIRGQYIIIQGVSILAFFYYMIDLIFWLNNSDNTPNILLILSIIIIAIIGLTLMFKKGTTGPNQYGPDPLSLKFESKKSGKTRLYPSKIVRRSHGSAS